MNFSLLEITRFNAYGKYENGDIASAGIYLYRLKTTDIEQVKKLMLLK